MTCEHERYIPEGFDPDWNVMNWSSGLKVQIKSKWEEVHICKKCMTMYATDEESQK